MKKMLILLVSMIFLLGCATSPVAGENNININFLEGQWLGQVKVATVKSGVIEYNASVDIRTGEKKVILTVGAPKTFENCIFKDGYLFGEKKKTHEWIKVSALDDGRIKLEFEIQNKNPALANVKGEGLFVRYQK
jgi:hypothetical protein